MRAHTSMRPLHQHRGSRLRYKFWLDWPFVECTVGPARSEAQYAVGYTAILGERLLFFRDFAFELSHAHLTREHDFDSAPREILVASEMRPTSLGPESWASSVRQFHLAVDRGVAAGAGELK